MRSLQEEVQDEDSLIEWMASGARTPDDWRIGSEHERFLYEKKPNKQAGQALHRHLQWQGETGIRAFLENPTPKPTTGGSSAKETNP